MTTTEDEIIERLHTKYSYNGMTRDIIQRLVRGVVDQGCSASEAYVILKFVLADKFHNVAEVFDICEVEIITGMDTEAIRDALDGIIMNERGKY